MRSKRVTIRLTPLAMAVMFAFTTVVVRPSTANAQAATATVPNYTSCKQINAFGNVVIRNATSAIPVLKAQLDNVYARTQAIFKAEDANTVAIQQASLNAFIAGVNAVEKRSNSRQVALYEVYKKTVSDELNTFYTNTDAARSQYEEDMLALMKQHETDLLNAANDYVTNLTNLRDSALGTCNGNVWAGSSFFFHTLSAGMKYDGTVLNVGMNYLEKALKIAETYIGVIGHEVIHLAGIVLTAVFTVLTGLIRIAFS